MTYNEADHPRDEKGRWTYADGGAEENKNSNDTQVLKGRVEKIEKSPADILYKKSREVETKQKEDKIYRYVLLDTLGKLATPAVVLYSKTKDLEKMVKDNGLVNKLNETLGAIKSYNKNYHDIKEANTKNADKYFHAKANCEASQYGKTSANVARKLGDLREKSDLIKNRIKNKPDGTKMTKEEIIKDYQEDQTANLYGRLQGLQNPNIDCKILVDKYRPKGLNKKY